MPFPKVITPPAEEPILAAAIKSELNLSASFTADDALITAKIKEARQEIENQYGISFVNQTLEEVFQYMSGAFCLSVAPLVSLDKFDYIEGGNTTYTDYSTTNFAEDTHSWPSVVAFIPSVSPPTVANILAPVKIRYTAGFGAAADDVPEDLIKALKYKVVGSYWSRLDQVRKTQYDTACERILRSYFNFQ